MTRFLCLLVLVGALPLLVPFAASGTDPWAKLRRPLHVPRLAPGAPCPVTPAHSTRFGAAQGPGPVWPVLGFPELKFVYPVPPTQPSYPSDWGGNKILWIAHRYHGPVLIRGTQLDGPNRVRFGNDHFPAPEMRLLSVGGNSPGGWQNRPSMTRVRAPGCYAWQVDGTRFSRIIVFKAVIWS